MKEPVEAFTWLLDQFRRYSRLQLSWQDARATLAEADDLCEQFRALESSDDIAMFGMSIRHKDRNANGLAECTDDYLRRKMGQLDPTTAGYISLLLWRRQQPDT